MKIGLCLAIVALTIVAGGLLRKPTGLKLSQSAMHGHDSSSLTSADRVAIHEWLEKSTENCTVDWKATAEANKQFGFDNVRIATCSGIVEKK